jgi:hypothetical protein
MISRQRRQLKAYNADLWTTPPSYRPRRCLEADVLNPEADVLALGIPLPPQEHSPRPLDETQPSRWPSALNLRVMCPS